ncbi:MAG TPA: hypothetical protein VMH80_19580 [Bryobacteraceae bacterium]|nr:hypothetical protein [Bryobacteraceae bacterium]
MNDFTRLLSLLEHIHSHESCSEILAESDKLVSSPNGWFFERLHEIVLSAIDDPETFYGVSESTPSPVLESIALAAQHGIAAIRLGDKEQLEIASQELSRSLDA